MGLTISDSNFGFSVRGSGLFLISTYFVFSALVPVELCFIISFYLCLPIRTYVHT